MILKKMARLLCCTAEKIIDHLLIHCIKAKVCGTCCLPFLVCPGFFIRQLKRSFLGGMARLWAREKKGLESSPFVSLLDSLEGKK
ncbi:hypothetical protein CK203_021361 [Vitis vinifera]|uniref:Uncharacterized protein n=1 Tax=Vitis vinifera TaxID=29760 RepID=A0A438IS82_VITVI|nr:hypothetical protein CK203_021361 [Vitis vinifera]